ncbi:MAG: O-antigen ligase family protein [Bacteroidaceae bacterium]|nr:O-antigen ligase family protein [Bacteroidaceae bacterium]
MPETATIAQDQPAQQSSTKKNKYSLPLVFVVAFIINYVLMGLNRYGYTLPVPISVHAELCYVVLLIYGFSHSAQWGTKAGRAFGTMTGIYLVWTFYSALEAINMSSEIGFVTILTSWLAEFRTMTLQVFWVFMINSLFFYHKDQLTSLFKLWGWLTLIAVGWALRQQFGGFDRTEWIWLLAIGMKTHFVNGIIRYFSFFTDAANYGCCMAATACIYGALFLTTTSSKRNKWFYGIVCAASIYGMMASGSRSAIFVLGAGLVAYCALSKRVATIVTTGVLGGLFIGMLAFTQIGQGNAMIRRMRSAFDKDDNSLAVREINKAAMERYIDEKPFGLGAGIRGGDVPPTNKNHYLATVAPDSTWVYVNIHYGHLGLFIFLLSYGGMIAVGSTVVLFRLKDKELSGMMAGLVAGAFAMLIAGYANQIMLQFPNCWLFFGNLSLVMLALDIDRQLLEEKARAENEAFIEEQKQAAESIYPLERLRA